MTQIIAIYAITILACLFIIMGTTWVAKKHEENIFALFLVMMGGAFGILTVAALTIPLFNYMV